MVRWGERAKIARSVDANEPRAIASTVMVIYHVPGCSILSMATVGNAGERTRSINVLVVDDEPQMAELVGTYLERTDDGLNVATATSASEGLDALSDSFDCVISDYHMPQMNGLAFLERVGEQVPDAVRILYTSDDDTELMISARDNGIDYVHKEVSTEQYAAMATHIRRRTTVERR